jgi:hypothetical protein
MGLELYLIIILLALAGLYFLVPRVAGSYLKFRGKRVITCPETRRPAAVDMDVKRVVLTAVLGEPHLRLKDCSRWPEKKDCGQECLLQVELSPEDCLVRRMLTGWYEGKFCVFCGEAFTEINLLDHKPALMTNGGVTVEWGDFRPETLPEVLATHWPVCWDCHIAETFRRQYPDMAVDRDWPAGALARDKTVPAEARQVRTAAARQWS